MISDQDVALFTESFALSNTPEFLLRRFLAEPRLQSIAAENSVDDLLTIVRAADSAEQERMLDLVRGYIAAVALFVKSDQPALDALRIWTPRRLRWLPSLLSTWDQIRTPTSIEALTFIHAASSADAIRSSSSNSSVRIAF